MDRMNLPTKALAAVRVCLALIAVPLVLSLPGCGGAGFSVAHPETAKAASAARTMMFFFIGASFAYYVVFPLVLQRIYDDKGAQEEMITSSHLDWTIVRPGILTNGPASGRYHALIDAEAWRGGFVSRRDVADYLVHQIADRSCIGKTPALVR